jgi:hypothetical protein
LPGSCALGPWPTELLPVVPPELKCPAMRGEVLMEMQDGQPGRRRLVGIDLGIASRHAVRVLEADGQAVCRASCVPTVESLAAVERAALAGALAGTRLAVVSGSDGAGVDADRGVLREPRPCRVPGVVGEGRGPAQVPAPACQDQRHRR